MPKSTKTPQCTWKRGSPIRTRSPMPCPVQAKRPKNRAAAAPSPLCPKRSPNSITCRRAGTRSSPRVVLLRRAVPRASRHFQCVAHWGAGGGANCRTPRRLASIKVLYLPPSVTPLLAVLWIYITVVIALHLPVESVLEWGSLLDFNLIWQTGRRQRRKIIYALCDSVRAGSPLAQITQPARRSGPDPFRGHRQERWCVFIARARSTRRTCGSMLFLTAPHARAHTQATDIEEIDPNTRVSVGAAMLIKGFLSSYHEYKIDCTPSLTSSIITHRYSDFDWLYKHLVVAFPGVPLPKLPPKETSSIFQAQRTRTPRFWTCAGSASRCSFRAWSGCLTFESVPPSRPF